MSSGTANSNRGRKKRNKSSSGGKKKKKFDAGAFWGSADELPAPAGFETSTPDPVAVVNSLGQPPLPGHGAASPHYFKLVYDRSTQLAAALAMAGGIDDLTPEPAPEPEVDEDEPIEMSADEEGETDSPNLEDE